MKLDSRILEGKKPLTCFDIDKAEQFIGKKGYFCDHISGFTNISNLSEDVLRDITPDEIDCEVYKTNCTSWEYFLPEEWVEQKNKINFEQYTLDTWEQEFEPGDVITFRGKVGTSREGRQYKCIYAGWRFIGSDITQDANVTVALGFWAFPFSELFDLYEIKRDGEWQPFGILEE